MCDYITYTTNYKILNVVLYNSNRTVVIMIVSIMRMTQYMLRYVNSSSKVLTNSRFVAWSCDTDAILVAFSDAPIRQFVDYPIN